MKSNIIILINSLSMNEKRFFKIFCSRHVLGSQNKYVILFDLLYKYQEVSINIFEDPAIDYPYSTKNISADINYLENMVYRSINEFNRSKTTNLKVKNQLITIEILFYKGLYDMCLKQIRKAKKSNCKNINNILFLELLEWEKKCLGYSKGLNEALKINTQIVGNFNSIESDTKITALYYKSYELKNAIGNMETKLLEIAFHKIINDPLCINPPKDQHSIKYQIFYHLIFAYFHHFKKQEDQELKNYDAVITIFDNNTTYKSENPLDYVSVYVRALDLIKWKANKQFPIRLNKLRSFDNILSFQKQVVTERIYFHSHKAELEYLIYTNNITEATTLMKSIEKTIISIK